MSVLIIIRHGQSEFNLQNKFTGEIDVSLTELGKKEAVIAARKLREEHIIFSCAFASSLKRAHETLDIILEYLGLNGKISISYDRALNERNYGELQGLDKLETMERFSKEQVHHWRRGYHHRPPGGESLEDTYNRVIPYYRENIAPLLSLGLNVLVVAHGNSLRALMMYLENINEDDIEETEIATGLPRLYRFDESMVVIEKRNL
jgi:2,3-bisphosphoglycerate-dependent phosphoglycerate mutase